MKLKVNGHLGALLDQFAAGFAGSAAHAFKGVIGFLQDSSNITLLGRTLEVPGSGPDFLDGTVTKMELDEFVPGGEPPLVDRLTFKGISLDASKLFDLAGRKGASARGDFDDAFFHGFLKGDWAISGGSGADIIGPNGWMALSGANRITAKGGDDLVDGGAKADTVFGGSGHDMLWGGTGDDTLSGGFDDDLLVGGSGADVFVFAKYGGADTVADFDLAVDRLDLGDAGPFQVADVEGGAQVQFEGGSVLLWGVAASDVTDDLLV